MMLRRAPRLLGVALLATAFVAACDDDDGDDIMEPEGPESIAEIAAGSEDFDSLEAALAAAGLTATLDGTGPFTVFAPTDAAFDALPAGTVDDLLLPENQAALPAARYRTATRNTFRRLASRRKALNPESRRSFVILE